MPLPIGFFMPLPLPIMIPFMMWQSAAIAAGFGTYFQFAKRKVSAMSNEEFNNTNPHELVNDMYQDIVKQIPSSFAKVDSLTPVMLQSMNVMLDQAVKWLQGAITGNIFGTPNPVNPENPELEFNPDPTDNRVLLSVDANTIKNWSKTKLANEMFLIQRNQSQYDLATQQIIISLVNVRDRPEERNLEPGPSIDSFKFNGVPTSRIPTGLHSLVIKRLVNETNLSKVYLLLAAQRSQFLKASLNTRASSAARSAALSIKNEIEALIVWLNKTFIPNR